MYLVVVFYFDLSFKTFIKISGIVRLFMSNTSDLHNLGAVYLCIHVKVSNVLINYPNFDHSVHNEKPPGCATEKH